MGTVGAFHWRMTSCLQASAGLIVCGLLVSSPLALWASSSPFLKNKQTLFLPLFSAGYFWHVNNSKRFWRIYGTTKRTFISNQWPNFPPQKHSQIILFVPFNFLLKPMHNVLLLFWGAFLTQQKKSIMASMMRKAMPPITIPAIAPSLRPLSPKITTEIHLVSYLSNVSQAEPPVGNYVSFYNQNSLIYISHDQLRIFQTCVRLYCFYI